MEHCCERVACGSNRVIIERPRVPRRQVVHYFSHELLLLLDWQRLELGKQFCRSSAHSGKGILHQINRRENRSSLRSLYNNDHLLYIVTRLRCMRLLLATPSCHAEVERRRKSPNQAKAGNSVAVRRSTCKKLCARAARRSLP